jgi:deoxycytidylate deaminase
MHEQLVLDEGVVRKACPSSVVNAIILPENKIRIIGSNGRPTFEPTPDQTHRNI